jgi:hypothetical protein
MFGQIDYDCNHEVSELLAKSIDDSLHKIMGKDFTQDWIDLVQYYTSNKCKSTKEELLSDLKEMLIVD